MIQHQGIWFPDSLRDSDKWRYSLEHVQSVEWAIRRCRSKRTALQAGGNIGLWPKRLAEAFDRVITFEPDAISRECLIANVPTSVEVRSEALGEAFGHCAIARKSVGSHRVVPGDAVEVIPIDSLGLTDLDFLQLDVEGYEWHALRGAVETIHRCHPLIQVELRGFAEKYGQTDLAVRGLLVILGYAEVSRQAGADVVFAWGQA
jgi:FkbM family methyltransferase